MVVTLPNYTAFDVSSLHDLEVRLGSDLPGFTTDPSTINTRCTAVSGQLSASKGAIVRLACPTPIETRMVTLQIRWGVC